mmetsp:Transcript_14093/g.39442  ORF Transcript_14093/g.39442 Transcript_14093/m.39442 type:complete len:518 (+) Transcript_14093:285-1838(+)
MDSLNRQQQKRRRQLPAPACTPTKHHAVLLLLLILVVLPTIWVPVSSLRTPTSIGSPRGTTATSLGGARVAMIPRGGSDSGKKPDAKKSSGKKSEDSIDEEADEEDETEVETEASDEEEMKEEVAEMVEVVEAEVEEIAEVVDGELAEEEVEDAVDVEVRSEAEEEETIEEVDAEVSDAIETKEEEEEEEEGGDEEEEDEEEEEDGVVYPTDEIPSDDVRAFHTTDGELADDEGMYTDGQNESPIAVDDSEEDEEEPEIQTSTEVEDAMSVPAPAPFNKSVIPTAATSDAAYDDEEEDAAVPVLTVIDEGTKRVLISELRYTKADVSQMRPEVAGEVVRNRLMRPTEGMPPSFYIDPSQIPKKKVLSRKNIVLSVVGVAILSFGATTLKDQENDLGKTVEDFVEALKDIREKIMALIVFAKSTSTKVETKADDVRKKIEAIEAKVEAVKSVVSEALDEDDEEETEEAVADDGDEAVHSIRPGTKAEEIPDPDADKTWLDKALTGVERSIKKFLSIEI